MTIRIGDWEFDNGEYDAEADVLYLSIGEPRPAVGEETREGHVLLFDSETGEFCGLTLISIAHLIALHGDDLTVTVPHAERIDAADLKPVLTPARTIDTLAAEIAATHEARAESTGAVKAMHTRKVRGVIDTGGTFDGELADD